jgi:type I restriction enzyme S subunit
MEVKPRYWQTEIGVIPVDWDCERIGDAAANVANSIVGGPFGSDLVSADYVNAGVPVIRGQNMSANVVSGEFVFVSPQKARSLSANLAHPSDLVFTQRGTLGQVSIVPPKSFECYLISQSQMKVSLNITRHDPCFVRQYFSSGAGQKQIATSAIQTGVPHTNLRILRAYHFPAPPLPEQRAIATALSDVDALLGGLDRLIAKKHDLKQAAMQQLLTGQTRLPGFHGEWEVKRLGELGTLLKGSGVKKDEARSGELPCIRYGEIYTHHNDYVRAFNSWISREVAETATPLRRGDILFAGSGETKEEIGKCVAFVDDVEAYAGGDIVILRPTGVASLFLGYLFNTPAVASQKASQAQGDAVVHISARALASISLSLPRLGEQSAIAEVLSDMDAELAALEARRNKTRNLKQAMMQELLTGNTRLVSTGGAHV